jgi:hypothetical protein
MYLNSLNSGQPVAATAEPTIIVRQPEEKEIPEEPTTSPPPVYQAEVPKKNFFKRYF